ncbi:hypothetical protein WA158_005636 [Blastocystis sp. Blastoise]
MKSIQVVKPEAYEKVSEYTPKMEEIKETVVPPELKTAMNLLIDISKPFGEKIMTVPVNKLLPAVYNAAFTQIIPTIPGELFDLKNRSFLNRCQLYSRFACGIYGSSFSQDFLKNPSSYNLQSIFNGLFDPSVSKDNYIQFFINHTGIKKENILYTSFTSEKMSTSKEVDIHTPPLFIVQDDIYKSIVIICRGTDDMNDAFVDLMEQPMMEEEMNGFIHEGMGRIAKRNIENEDINSVLIKAFGNNPDYSLYSVGHSLGASVASLMCLYWHQKHMYEDHSPKCICFAPAPCISKTYKNKGEDCIISFINEDDIVPRCNADCVHLFAEHVYLCSQAEKLEDIDQSQIEKLYTESPSKYPYNLVAPANFILPGKVYYMNHDIECEEDYRLYEGLKIKLYDLFKQGQLPELIKSYSKLPDNPYIKIFNGSEMPKGVRIFPWIIMNHSILEYEKTLNGVCKNCDEHIQAIKEEKEKEIMNKEKYQGEIVDEGETIEKNHVENEIMKEEEEDENNKEKENENEIMKEKEIEKAVENEIMKEEEEDENNKEKENENEIMKEEEDEKTVQNKVVKEEDEKENEINKEEDIENETIKEKQNEQGIKVEQINDNNNNKLNDKQNKIQNKDITI